MRIIGFNLTKIQIERKEDLKGQLQVNQSIDIVNIEKHSLPITNSNDQALKINFSFSIAYSENSAKLEFEGFLIMLPEDLDPTKTLKEWKDKQISDNLRTPLYNFIMNKCNIKALDLEDQLGLPSHLPMPRYTPQKESTNQ
jgi:hypothetical protein